MTKPIKVALLLAVLALLLLSQAASAHCDALDGPVVSDARLALERRNPVLAVHALATHGASHAHHPPEGTAER